MNILLGQIDPVAIRLGPLEIAWYGILIVVGMLLAIWLTVREGEKRGISEDFIIDIAFWTIPIGIIGARIYYVLFEWQVYVQDPIRIFYVWEGGLAIYGGLIAGLLVISYFCHKYEVPLILLLDIVAPHVLLAQSIGRWGNFINQEAFGEEVSRTFLENLLLPEFLIEQMYINGAYYHPTFLYESIWTLIGFIIIMIIRNKDRFLLRGEPMIFYLVWYGIGRTFIEGLRTDSLYLGPLRVSQVLSLILVVFGIGLFIYRRFYQFPQPPYYSRGLQPEIEFNEKKKAYKQRTR